MVPHSAADDDSYNMIPDVLSPGSSTSMNSMLAKGAVLMKEEDAALLERGVRDSCSSGQTPVFAPISPPSTDDLPMITPAATSTAESSVIPGELKTQVKQLIRNSVEFSNTGQAISLASTSPKSPLARRTSDDLIEGVDTNGGLNNNNNSELCWSKEKGKYLYRTCLSGDVRARSGILDPSSDRSSMTTGEETISISPISVADEVRSSNPNDAPEEEEEASKEVTLSVSSSFKTRSKSYDRRLNEAMQFAEAVGEMPPLSQNEVQVIIEETESDYDDDDSDNEILVDTSVMASSDDSSVKNLQNTFQSSFTTVKRPSFAEDAELSVGEQSCNETSHLDDQQLPLTPLFHRRQKSRPHWPFATTANPFSTVTSPDAAFLHKLPSGVNKKHSFVYKGICSNPPEITKRGLSRGNYAQLHRKAWLEVSDKYHRYGKNLRLYYRYWEALEYPTNQFFDWLDSKGEAAGQPLPNLDECPRSQLDSDTVHYITNPDVTEGYAMTIKPDGKGKAIVRDVDGDPVCTGSDGWIFVLRDNTLYGNEKITSVSGHSKQRFHHSSFFGGKAVAAAGIVITNEKGIMVRLYPHSGHYRPGEADMQRMLFHLHDKGVDLGSFEMDTQQILHVTRETAPITGNNNKGGMFATPGGEKKKKKTQSLHLKKAAFVACFLAHKARFIGEGIFDQIHKIRKANVTSVVEALEECDDGGYWARIRNEYRRQQ